VWYQPFSHFSHEVIAKECEVIYELPNIDSNTLNRFKIYEVKYQNIPEGRVDASLTRISDQIHFVL